MFNKRHANPRQKFELLKGKPALSGIVLVVLFIRLWLVKQTCASFLTNQIKTRHQWRLGRPCFPDWLTNRLDFLQELWMALAKVSPAGWFASVWMPWEDMKINCDHFTERNKLNAKRHNSLFTRLIAGFYNVETKHPFQKHPFLSMIYTFSVIFFILSHWPVE